MLSDKLLKFFSIFFFFFLLLFSAFLNFISSLYSEADLFKVDLNKKRKSKKSKKLLFVLKNNQLLSATVSFWQVLINLAMSSIITKTISENAELSNKIWWGKGILFFLISLFIAFFTEIFIRFIAIKKSNKRTISNYFLINIAYFLNRSSPFRWIIKPKKKVFVNSEKDVSLFVSNLAAEKILEKKEAKLIKAALDFDEIRIRQVSRKWNKVICIDKNINYEELKKTHLNFLFSRYPVINKKKQLLGIFNMKVFLRERLKKKNIIWQDYIDKEFITVRTQDKLNKVFEKLQSNYCHLAIVKSSKKIEGIVTSQDILNCLVGKMKDEKDKFKPSS